ncbi:cobalt transporter ATP-binding subunit [candidate division MSBL1 archaeon SCGC-AAA259E17]|uniref:Cobalt transporter ATP-binding subunit n=1 Tax=candidate division MSBL1 archaeon SCGC-AAA259E17 TaxID=1698263 RepID=A0A133UHC5_9EURY|nr:cobalt transporter ATP-binding subunit [candidate division MSBL1 archaeon SCGC-AAA259E17]
MSQSAIKVENLNYRYPDGTEALTDVSLEIGKGEKVAIVGPNGAGKTTFLLNLNGVLENDRGRVEIFGKDVEGLERSEIIQHLGIVFQDPDDQLFMPTIFDDVAFAPMNMGLDGEKVKKRVEEALSTVGLSGHEEVPPQNLSYGEKKKASIAVALSIKPEILIFDEPTSELDPKSRSELIGKIKELNEKEEITTLTATHDVNAVPEIADRVYVLNKRVIAEGTPREVFTNENLLEENSLDTPDVFKLFKVLNCFGLDSGNLPLSIDEAIKELTEKIETGSGHMHLHVHEHTHEDIEKLRKRYEHHT